MERLAKTTFFICRILVTHFFAACQTPFCHDKNLVSQKVQLFSIVTSHSNNCAALFFFAHNCLYTFNSRWVKCVDRLIQKNEIRIFHNGARNPQTLLHAK